MRRENSQTVLAGDGESSLRVLHVVEAFCGGVFETVKVLTDRLTSLDVKTAVAYGVRPETPSDVACALANGVEAFPLPWTTRSLTAQVASGLALRRLCQRWQPDVIHLHSSFAGLVGVASLRRRFPIVYTPHGYSFSMSTAHPVLRQGFRLAESFVASRVDAVGAVSQWESWLASTKAGAGDVFVIENGIPELDDRPAAESLVAPSIQPTVIAMGRVCPARRPQEAAAILDGVRDLASVLWVGGAADQTDRSELDRRAIPVTGWLSRADAVEHLRLASVCLHWAAWDAGAPLAVLEAMAYDVPVVGSDIPPLRAVLDSCQLAPNVQAAIDRIRQILTDEEVRRRIQAHQQQQRNRYGADRMARSWLRQYERLSRFFVRDGSREPSSAARHDPTPCRSRQ